MSDDIDTLARTLYGESRGEGYLGMKAVACVVMNRVALKKWYGLTPHEVCMKPFQFSCWNRNDVNCEIIKDVDAGDPIFSQCLQIAKEAVSGMLDDITGGSTHYYDKRMKEPPGWTEGHTPCAAVGHHLFFAGIS